MRKGRVHRDHFASPQSKVFANNAEKMNNQNRKQCEFATEYVI